MLSVLSFTVLDWKQIFLSVAMIMATYQCPAHFTNSYPIFYWLGSTSKYFQIYKRTTKGLLYRSWRQRGSLHRTHQQQLMLRVSQVNSSTKEYSFQIAFNNGIKNVLYCAKQKYMYNILLQKKIKSNSSSIIDTSNCF